MQIDKAIELIAEIFAIADNDEPEALPGEQLASFPKIKELALQALAKLREVPKPTEFTEKWRIKHGEPLTYNERIINSACDIIDQLQAEKADS